MIDGEQYDEALAMITMLRAEGYKDPSLDLLQGKTMARQGLFTEAETILLRAKERMRKSADVHHELGILYADAGRTAQAIEAFKIAVELDENRASDWNNLGFLLFSEQNFTDSVTALREAVKIDPTKDKYRINLAFSLFGEQKKKEAMRVFKSVLPTADAHYNMGVAHELSGDQNGANEQYTLALNENPTHEAAQTAQRRLQTEKESLK